MTPVTTLLCTVAPREGLRTLTVYSPPSHTPVAAISERWPILYVSNPL